MRVTAGLARNILVRVRKFKARSWSVSARGDAELLLEKTTEMGAAVEPPSEANVGDGAMRLPWIS